MAMKQMLKNAWALVSMHSSCLSNYQVQSSTLRLRSGIAYSVKNAKKVFTISNSSKNDIIKEYKVSPEKVIVTHLGIKEAISLTPHIYSMNELKAKYGLSDNFILFVGTLQPRKNIS